MATDGDKHTNLVDFFTNNSHEECFDLEITLTDTFSVGYMKDFYALDLFL